MAETAKFQQRPQARSKSRVKAEHRYPVYDLNSSTDVAREIRDKGGGTATIPHLAGFLGYSSTTSGAFITRVAAARLFGLIENNGQFIVPTSLANTIMAPEHPGEDDLRGRIEAFMNVPLYRALYDRYKTGPLPPEAGLRNALETHYNTPRGRTKLAYRVFMDSADEAGLFEARGGARTHLVMPMISPAGVPSGQPEEGPLERREAIGDRPPTLIEMRAGGDVMEKLQQALVEKIKDIPATDLDTIREYIKEIKELGAEKEEERG